MSFIVMTPDFYQYQIITQFPFQVGGWIAFLRGDAGKAVRKQNDVSCCSDSRLRETIERKLKLPLLPLPLPLL